MVENLKALAEKWRAAAYDLQRFGQGGGLYLVCANELLAAIDSQAAPEVCKWEGDSAGYTYETECGETYPSNCGEEFTYCPDCGRKIEVCHE